MKTALLIGVILAGLLAVPTVAADGPTDDSPCPEEICGRIGACIHLAPGYVPPVIVDPEACIP